MPLRIKYILSICLTVPFLFSVDAYPLEVGDIAKNFALRDKKGGIVTLGATIQNSKATVLKFVSVYCEACKKQTADVNRIADEYGNKGVEVMAVALANDQADVDRVVAQWQPRYSLLADPDKYTYYLYTVPKVPQYFIIDNSGIIRYRGTGDNHKEIEQTLKRLLKSSRVVSQAGDPAGSFSLENLHGDLITVRFRRRHQNTALLFLAHDDASNSMYAAAINEQYRRHKDRGLRVYGIISKSFGGGIRKFIQENRLEFPILMDSGGEVFSQYRVTGYPELIIVNETGRLKIRSQDKTYEELQELFKRAEQGVRFVDKARESRDVLKKFMPDVRSIKPLTVGNETIYAGIDKNGEHILARIIKKDIMCNVCSDVHFILTLNREGIYKNIYLIIPLELYGTPIDATDFVQQFIGKSFHKPFMPGNVDMITGATKSCIKVLEGLNETEKIFARYLDDPRFDSTFRTNLCYLEQSDLELALQQYLRKNRTDIFSISIEELADYCPDKKLPTCPAGGAYMLTIFNDIPRVMCTVHGLDPQSSMIH